MGKAMDGAGKVATFAVEEVGPQALKAHVLGGADLNWKLFKQVGRDILKKRAAKAGENHLLRLAERIARRQAAQGEALATLDMAVEATNEAEFGLDAELMTEEEMQATREARKTPQSAQVPDNGSSGNGGGGDGGDSGAGDGSGPNFTSYTFTDRDVPNFGSSTFGTSMFTWHRWAGHVPAAYLPIYNYCFYVSTIPIETGTVRVTFDQETMTASGTVEGDFHLTKTPDSYAAMGTTEIDVRGSYRVEFSNLPGTPTDNGYSFTGTGNAELQIGGSIICRGHDTDTNQDFFKPIADQSSAQMQIPLSVTLWNPGTLLLGSQPTTVSISGDAGPVNDLSISLYLILD